jgi:hypothetical protein
MYTMLNMRRLLRTQQPQEAHLRSFTIAASEARFIKRVLEFP